MTGKQKCAILKQIRRDVAAKNDIRITIEECTHKGNCKGTCPRCEAEVRMLERELEKKRKAGVRTVLAGVSAGLLAASLASCTPVEKVKDQLHLRPVIEDLEGDVPREVETESETEPELLGDPILPEEVEVEEVESGEIEPESEDEEALAGEPVAYAPEEEEPEIAGIVPAPEEDAP